VSQVQPERAQVEEQYWGNPKVARLEGTPAIHVTCLYVSWYVRVVDTHSILKYYCLDLSWHKRATTWLFHVGASQYYCLSHLSSRRSDCGLTMQVSCFSRPTWHEDRCKRGHTWGRQSTPQYHKYLCTVIVEHTLLCTRLNKITGKGVGAQHLGVTGRPAWPQIWGGPVTIYIMYTKQQDKTVPAGVGNHTCDGPTLACGDSLGPMYNIRSYHRPTQDKSSRNESPETTVVHFWSLVAWVVGTNRPQRDIQRDVNETSIIYISWKQDVQHMIVVSVLHFVAILSNTLSLWRTRTRLTLMS